MFGYSAYELVNFTFHTAGDQQKSAGNQDSVPPELTGLQPDGEMSLSSSKTKNAAARTVTRFLKSSPLSAA